MAIAVSRASVDEERYHILDLLRRVRIGLPRQAAPTRVKAVHAGNRAA